MFRVQTVSLLAEPYYQDRDAREPAPAVVPVYGHPSAHVIVIVTFSNAKRLFLDVYQDICPDYIQNNLDGFCWKSNCRYLGDAMFDRLVVAGLAYKNEFRYRIN